jgi:hypothetical protein
MAIDPTSMNNASFGISLNPPGAEGDPFSNNVTYANGKPLGGGDSVNHDSLINNLLGYVDTLESSEDTSSDVKAALSGFNIGVLLMYNNMSPEQQLQMQIDSLDPSNPVAPILLKYVKIADDALKSGDLAGVSVHLSAKSTVATSETDEPNQATESAKRAVAPSETDEPTQTTGTDKTPTTEGTADPQVVVEKGNPWLVGNAYTQFVTSYAKILEVLKEMKEIDSKLELEGMAQIYELAQQSAQTIKDAAKERAMMHILQAVMAGISIAFTVGMTAVSVYQTTKFKVEENSVTDPTTGVISGPTTKDATGKEVGMTKAQAKDFNRNLTSGGLGTMTIQAYIQAVQAGAKAMDDIIQAIFEVRAAEYDALKEILQAYRTIAQHQMDRAVDGFKSESDMITQLIQQLDQMRQKLMEAISASLRNKG